MKSNCLNCGIEFRFNPANKTGKYCSNKCQQQYQSKQIVEEWKRNPDSSIGAGYKLKGPIRKYLIEKSQNVCSKCGWGEINPYTNNVPLEIHHIDGDCSNNVEENLQVLCPNCHSLSHNYKGANKKGAGTIRAKYHRSKKGSVAERIIAESC